MDSTEAMTDDQGLVTAALAMARAVRDDVPTSKWTRVPVLIGVGATICALAARMNHKVAAAELRAFGADCADTSDNNELDDLIHDHLESARSLCEDDRYFD
jgi:hypothetical protein